MFDRSRATEKKEQKKETGVVRRILGATLVAVAIVLITLLSGADARACPKEAASKAPASISLKSHKSKVVAAGNAQIASITMRPSSVRMIDLMYCCGKTSQSDSFDCTGQCCVACSAAIGVTALSLPSPDRSTDRILLLSNWAFSLRLPPLFRPPRSLA